MEADPSPDSPTMAGGMDRLERLFKKRHAASRSAPETERLSERPRDPAFSSDMRFPAPSFIRPRNNKMQPREDSATGFAARPFGTARGHSKAKTTDTNDYRPGRISTTSDGEKRSIFHNAYTLRFPSVDSSAPTESGSSTGGLSSDSSASVADSPPPPPVSPRSSLQNRRKVSIAMLRSSHVSTASRFSTPTTSSGELSPTTTFQSTTQAAQSTTQAVQPTTQAVQTTTQAVQTTTQAVQPTSSVCPSQPPQLRLKLSGLQDLHPLFLQARSDTPPSDQDSKLQRSRSCASTRPPSSQTVLAHSPSIARLSTSVSIAKLQPTPETSPRMAFVSDAAVPHLPERPLRTHNSVVSVVLAQDYRMSVATTAVEVDAAADAASDAANNAAANAAATTADATKTVKPLPPSPATRRKARASRRPSSLRFNRQLPVEWPPLSAKSVLKEPNLGDFLSLSDDDIAEVRPVSRTATPAPDAALKEVPADVHATPTLRSATSFALTRTPPSVSPGSYLGRRPLHSSSPPSRPPSCMVPPPPPLSLAAPALFLSALAMSSSLNSGRPQSPASQVRMAAAFEIARIASQYKFDLAYIATIWPKNMVIQKRPSSRQADIWCPPCPIAVSGPSASVFAKRMARGGSQASSASSASSVSAGSSIAANHGSDSTSRTAATVLPGGLLSGLPMSPVKSSLGSQGSPAPMSPQSGLEAHFLAAYGLATVQAPYSLSAPTHARILDAERWIEFSEPDAKENDLFKGYGCAFHRSYAPTVAPGWHAQHHQRYRSLGHSSLFRQPSTDDCDADTEQDDGEDRLDRLDHLDRRDGGGRATPRPMLHGRTVSNGSSIHSVCSSMSLRSPGAINNRGIVFVAYRRKASEGQETAGLGVHDLDALYRDVENLVDRILDFHMLQQRQEQLEALRTMPGMADDLLASGAAMPCDVSVQALGKAAA